ncbi:aldehyde dehydrogenase family protein, partial [Microvirga sp. 3-52]|nr:aldehyde dehydrogenase family protein [Microvirga sp. 3-52]
DNLGDAIHRIRQLPKPLAGYMFTENEEAANYFIESLPFGGGCINDTVSHVGNTNLPFGGVGSSGMNAYHGKNSFNVFTHEKAMMQRSTKIPMRFAFPPYENKLKLIKPLIR